MSELHSRTERLMHESAPKITHEEYLNLEDLMTEFTKIPLLAEFRSPVAEMHPKLATKYFKIISRPMDLGQICRNIDSRQYTSTRDVRRDMWLMFANCENYHSHHDNLTKLPLFAEIGKHLRLYFNMFWQEFMLPSDLPPDADRFTVNAFAKRDQVREDQVFASGSIELSKEFLAVTSGVLEKFISAGGCVDRLDNKPLWDKEALATDAQVQATVASLVAFAKQLADREDGCRIISLYADLMGCGVQLEGELQRCFADRINRLICKRCSLVLEAKWRGNRSSSVFGLAMDIIWCRQGQNKPYRPCLKLGVRSPIPDQDILEAPITDLNLARLPPSFIPKLGSQYRRLMGSRADNVENVYLVEYLGLHHFDWAPLRKTLAFDPSSPDPNIEARTSNKSLKAEEAIETAREALKEAELVMSEAMSDYDVCDEATETYRSQYAYATLALGEAHKDDNSPMTEVDLGLANLLLSNEGVFDSSWVEVKRQHKRVLADDGDDEDEPKAVVKKRRDSIDSGNSSNADLIRDMAAKMEQLSAGQVRLKKENEQLADLLTGKLERLQDENSKLSKRLDASEEARLRDQEKMRAENENMHCQNHDDEQVNRLDEANKLLANRLDKVDQDRLQSQARADRLSCDNNGLLEKQLAMQLQYNATVALVGQRCQNFTSEIGQLWSMVNSLDCRSTAVEISMQENLPADFAALRGYVDHRFGERSEVAAFRLEVERLDGLVGRLTEQVEQGATVGQDLLGSYESLALTVQTQYDHVIRELDRLDDSDTTIAGIIESLKPIILHNFEAIWKSFTQLEEQVRNP